MTKKDHIRDDGQVGKYFTLLYNMADDDLNPYQYRLLGHYKRVCGETDDGACWESTRTTAKKCQISVGKIASTRRELEAMRYVSIETRGDDTLRITMIDRMAENVSRYTKRSSGEQGVHEVNTTVHAVNASVHEVKQRITTEEKPSKNNHDKKENAPSGAEPQLEIFKPIPSKKKQWADEDCLIDVWAGIRQLNAIAMGADYHTDSDRKKAKKMLAWSKPVTPDEIRDAMKASKYKGEYPFAFLEKDILEMRAKKAISAPEPIPQSTPEELANFPKSYAEVQANMRRFAEAEKDKSA